MIEKSASKKEQNIAWLAFLTLTVVVALFGNGLYLLLHI